VIQNPKLHALYSEINRLSDEDQQALVILLDSLAKRSQMGKVLAGRTARSPAPEGTGLASDAPLARYFYEFPSAPRSRVVNG
jgi:hypothetical protein